MVKYSQNKGSVESIFNRTFFHGHNNINRFDILLNWCDGIEEDQSKATADSDMNRKQH
tara:strand:+ start:27907 stop:28080 length:174 start_codon:yes stop_codon:yes gene_type:complete